jgi:predicted DCC family thiol-disulfide oxidoreductase YuxK
MDRLFILYDARCGLCSWAKRWLMRQHTLIDLRFVPSGSPVAERLFPNLTRAGDPPEELVVISDEGAVYRNGSAWIMCLFALEAYREWANRLAHPLFRPLARQAFALLSKQRGRISRWLSLASDLEIAETLSQLNVPACAPQPAVERAVQNTVEHDAMPSRGTNNDVAFISDEPSSPPHAPP